MNFLESQVKDREGKQKDVSPEEWVRGNLTCFIKSHKEEAKKAYYSQLIKEVHDQLLEEKVERMPIKTLVIQGKKRVKKPK